MRWSTVKTSGGQESPAFSQPLLSRDFQVSGTWPVVSQVATGGDFFTPGTNIRLPQAVSGTSGAA